MNKKYLRHLRHISRDIDIYVTNEHICNGIRFYSMVRWIMSRRYHVLYFVSAGARELITDKVIEDSYIIRMSACTPDSEGYCPCRDPFRRNPFRRNPRSAL